MTKFSNWRLLSILSIGVLVATIGAIGLALQEHPTALAQAAGYVPFHSASGTIVCDTAGGAVDSDKLTINGSSDFMVTGVVLKSLGVDSGSDSVVVISYSVDGAPFVGLNSLDITGSAPVSDANEILGLGSTTGGMLPATLAATGAGAGDIIFAIGCNAGTTSNINLQAEIHGWKVSGDTITALMSES